MLTNAEKKQESIAKLRINVDGPTVFRNSGPFKWRLHFSDHDFYAPSQEKLFQEFGLHSNGYSWESLARAFIKTKNLKGPFEFDSEAAGFHMCGNGAEELNEIREYLKNLFNDPQVLREALGKAKAISVGE